MNSLEDLYNGSSKKFSLSRNVICTKCKEKGSKLGASMKCVVCQGSGIKINNFLWNGSRVTEVQKGDNSNLTMKGVTNGSNSKYVVPKFGSFDFAKTDVMEEDFMVMERGLVYFEVNASSQFCGLADMAGPMDFEKNADYWQQDRWTGQFPVIWQIVKDVPNNKFRRILLENNDNKLVTHSRDSQELVWVGIHMSTSARTESCVGVGWYSVEGIHLVMERDYATDGKLIVVRSKSDVKIRWSDSRRLYFSYLLL